MSPSSPVRTRRPRRSTSPNQAESKKRSRGETVVFVVRSAVLVGAAVSVIAVSDYLAYLAGRKQVTYEELRRQVEDLALATPKQRQDRFEQHGSALTDLTTSTINGKTTVAPELAVTPPGIARLQPPEPPLSAATKQREMNRVAHQRVTRKPPARRAAAGPTTGEQSREFTTAAPDTGLAGQ